MITVKYEINDYLTMLMFCRLYLFFRLCLTFSQYMSSRSHRIGALNGCSMNQFALKCLMVDKPLQLQSSTMIISVLLFAYTLRIFEHPLGMISGMNWTFQNSVWCVIVTMATVGYGDFIPKSVMGRILGILICFWGVVVVSIFVVTLISLLKFETAEEKTY